MLVGGGGEETRNGGRIMEHDSQRPDENAPEPATGSDDPGGPGGPGGPPPTTPPTTLGPPQAAPPTLTDAEANTFAMLAHLAAFSGVVIPFGHLLGPLLVWLLKREQHPLVDDQGKESLNFQLSMSLYYVVGVLLIFVVIGFILLPALFIFSVVVTIMGAVKANGGERYRYPLNIRFIK